MSNSLETEYLSYIFADSIYVLDQERISGSFEQEFIAQDKSNDKALPPVEKPLASIAALPKVPVKMEEKLEKVDCILLYATEDSELPESEKTFCSQIMAACKLQANDYLLLNFNGLTIQDIKSRYVFNKIILFGISIPGLSIEKYQCTKGSNALIIAADPLWMIQSNKELKGFLWNQLQIMFGLKK